MENKIAILILLLIFVCVALKNMKRQNCENFDVEKNNNCILDKMEDDIFKFATSQKYNCKPNLGCSVCDMKYMNEVDVIDKLNKKHKKSSCIIEKMNDETMEYVKSLVF